MAGISQGSSSASFVYDSLHRLERVDDNGFYGRDFDYAYDGTGNLLAKNEMEEVYFTIHSDSNLIDWFEVEGERKARRYTPHYDNRGNMTYDGGLTRWHHTYNCKNTIDRSTRAKTSTQSETVSFVYDAFDRKIHRYFRVTTEPNEKEKEKTYSKVVSVDGGPTKTMAAVASSTSTTGHSSSDRWYFYDTTGRPIYEKDKQGAILNIFALGRRVARIASDGSIEYFHHDHLGSTVAATDSDVKIPAKDNPPDLPPVAEDLRITGPSILPAWPVSTYQVVQFRASGGRPPYQWSTKGNIPPSLSFTDGQLSGSAGTTEVGTYPLEVTVSDVVGNRATRDYSLRIRGGLSFVTQDLRPVDCSYCYDDYDDYDCYEYYEDQIIVEGGVPPYSWTVSGALPFELEYEPEGGSLWIWGDVECDLAEDAYRFAVELRDSQSPPATASREFVLTVSF